MFLWIEDFERRKGDLRHYVKAALFQPLTILGTIVTNHLGKCYHVKVVKVEPHRIIQVRVNNLHIGEADIFNIRRLDPIDVLELDFSDHSGSSHELDMVFQTMLLVE